MPSYVRHGIRKCAKNRALSLAVSVFAGGVERLAGEDLAGLRVAGDGPAVVAERFGHASRVALAGIEDPASAGDAVPRGAAAARRGRAGIRRAVR